MSDPGPEVLVVGAGPTGLLLAAELERRDVGCMLIDALDAPRGWDRATVVHARSLQILEALGIVDGVLDAGVRTRASRIYSDGALLGEVDLGLTGSRYGFQIGLSEEVTESVLTAHLEAHGGAVTRSTALVGLQAGEDAVTATLERDGERREVVVRWVVGCDGMHSAVREAVGIDFPGTDIDARWGVFDATLDGWSDDPDVVFAHLDRPPVILTPLPGRRWRVYLRPRSETSDLVTEAEEVLLRHVPGVAFTGIENPTRFRCHSRVAARYRSGRVLLAGDAAHACTPAEGHGMNTGLQDAFNLGWKLALVCRGEAGAGLLDTYEAERRPVAELVVSSGADAEIAHAMTDPGERAARDAELRRMLADPDLVHHEAAAASELDRSYPRSRAVAGDDNADLAPGVLLPDTPQRLHELTHRPGHTLLVLGGPQADPARVNALVTELDAVVGTMDEAVAAQLGVVDVTILAVRPDRYVGLRDDRGDPRVVAEYLDGLVA